MSTVANNATDTEIEALATHFGCDLDDARAALAAVEPLIRQRIAAEVLKDAAVAVVAERQMNPMNHDGGNYRVTRLDRIAGDDGPSNAAEHAWAVRMDEEEADYCKRHDMPRSTKTYVERLEAKRAHA